MTHPSKLLSDYFDKCGLKVMEPEAALKAKSSIVDELGQIIWTPSTLLCVSSTARSIKHLFLADGSVGDRAAELKEDLHLLLWVLLSIPGRHPTSGPELSFSEDRAFTINVLFALICCEADLANIDGLALVSDLAVRSGAVPWKWAARGLTRAKKLLPGLNAMERRQLEYLLVSFLDHGFNL